MREVDDKIIYALNTTIPTESFKGQVKAGETCQVLYNKLNEAHKQRANCIRTCIELSADRVKELKTQREANGNDTAIDKNFKLEQRKVSFLLKHIGNLFPQNKQNK